MSRILAVYDRNMSVVSSSTIWYSTHARVKTPRKMRFQYPMVFPNALETQGSKETIASGWSETGLKIVWNPENINLFPSSSILGPPHFIMNATWPAAHRGRKDAQQNARNLSSTLSLCYVHHIPQKTWVFKFQPRKKVGLRCYRCIYLYVCVYVCVYLFL